MTGDICEERKNDKNPNLETVLSRQLLPTAKGTPGGPDYARAGRPESGGDDLVTMIGKNHGLKLQPAFVEWMMGYPDKWTELTG